MVGELLGFCFFIRHFCDQLGKPERFYCERRYQNVGCPHARRFPLVAPLYCWKPGLSLTLFYSRTRDPRVARTETGCIGRW